MVVVMLFAVLPVFSQAAGGMYGDLNGDTKVNATDALIVLQAAVGKISLSEGDQKLADVDGSGDVMATDALLILQKAVGKIDRFPVEQTEKKVTWLESASGIVSETEPYIPAEGEIKTLYQSNVGYSGNYAVETDCVLTYVYSKKRGGNLKSWVQASGQIYDKTMKVGLMIPANRDDAEFLKANPDRGMKDVQTTSDGSYRKHSNFGDDIVYYMVPTEAYIQYKWEVIDSWLTEDCKVVAIEEPEIWNNAGYSEGFKEEWKKYYGTDWKDQTSSAQAMYDSQRLKAYLFKREIEFLSQKIKEKYPDVTVLLATHCTVDYSSHGISTGMSMYGSIPTVDGFIGQTWSDGVTRSIPYAGNQSVNTFAVSMYEYASYKAFLPEGKSLYLLQDPASDAGFPQDVCENNYKTTVVASLMQQDTDYFQNTIWPQRAFLPMGQDYKSIQLSVNKMYNSIAGLGSTVYSGTKGVYLGLSDTAGWNIGDSFTTSGRCLETVYGISASFIYEGIPVNTLCLETLTSADQLKDVNLLILSYDSMKPQSAKANEAIADWVKGGGRLLYVGGYDSFTDIKSEWWSKENTTPLEHLISKLGLDVKVSRGVDRGSVPVWNGSSINANDILNSLYASNTYTFTGSGVTAFMTASNKNVGIKTDVGDGVVTMVGLPSAFYAKSFFMSKVIRELAAYTLSGSDMPYQRSDFFSAVRGDYIAYYNFKAAQRTADGKTLVDLFSAKLDVVDAGSTVVINTPKLYYDVSKAASDKIPRLGFTNGVDMSPVTETAAKTEFTVTAPSNATIASRLFGNGKYPQNVTVVSASGKPGSVITVWDNRTNSLLVQTMCSDIADPVTVTVEWGDTYKELDSNYEYKSIFFATQGKTHENDEFLFDYNCHMNDGCYFCDLDTYCIWRIDLNAYKDASMTLDVMCNYVVSVSFDNKNWLVVEDWSTIGEFTKVAANKKSLTVSSSSYNESNGAQYMFVKLSSCYMDSPQNPGQGWGGNVQCYTLNYLGK